MVDGQRRMASLVPLPGRIQRLPRGVLPGPRHAFVGRPRRERARRRPGRGGRLPPRSRSASVRHAGQTSPGIPSRPPFTRGSSFTACSSWGEVLGRAGPRPRFVASGSRLFESPAYARSKPTTTSARRKATLLSKSCSPVGAGALRHLGARPAAGTALRSVPRPRSEARSADGAGRPPRPRVGEGRDARVRPDAPACPAVDRAKLRRDGWLRARQAPTPAGTSRSGAFPRATGRFRDTPLVGWLP